MTPTQQAPRSTDRSNRADHRPVEVIARTDVRTDGESGCERTNLSGVDAHDTRPRTLAYQAPCRYCAQPIYVALCRDGRWRSFDPDDVPAAPAGVWAWRKTWGMEEQELVPGKRLHYCAAYHRPNLAPWDR